MVGMEDEALIYFHFPNKKYIMFTCWTTCVSENEGQSQRKRRMHVLGMIRES
jgi:hypothetical protein